MAEYYLISQLPSLDALGDTAPLPITEERFFELCRRFLGKKSQRELDALTLLPSKSPEKSSSALITAWNDGERKLRFALAKIRAERLKKSFDSENESFPPELLQIARTAVESESPLEAEKLLNNYRLSFLETLRPTDTFAEDYIFYYGLKLKLISRIRQFDKLKGESAYKNIYYSIINGERLEAVQ